MSFTVNLITQRAGGGNIIREKKIAGAQAVIGRGADCDIQLPDLAVSLRHATMRQTVRGEIEVEAIGRMSFEADGAFTNHARLRLSDKPKLGFGNHELVLSRGSTPDDAVVTISRRADTQAQIAEADERKVFALSTSMFSRRRAAWALMIALLGLCLALPIAYFYLHRGEPLAATTSVFRADAQWESGSLSPGHRFLENNCQACHQKAFVSVRDETCVACHKPGLDKLASLQLAAQMREAGSQVHRRYRARSCARRPDAEGCSPRQTVWAMRFTPPSSAPSIIPKGAAPPAIPSMSVPKRRTRRSRKSPPPK